MTASTSGRTHDGPGRAFLSSPVAVAVAVAGGLAVTPVVAAGWLLAGAYRATGLATDPAFLGGFGQLGYAAIGVVVLGVAALLWMPFAAGIAYAVGNRARGRDPTLGGTVSVVLDDLEVLAKWAKTRVAVGPLADQLLSEDDVLPSEVAAGCDRFVVPALVLDAPDLPKAVERANRVPPGATGGVVALVPFALATAGAVGLVAWATTSTGGPTAPTVALAVAAMGLGVLATAVLDASGRALVYATTDGSDGFRDG